MIFTLNENRHTYILTYTKCINKEKQKNIVQQPYTIFHSPVLGRLLLVMTLRSNFLHLIQSVSFISGQNHQL